VDNVDDDEDDDDDAVVVVRGRACAMASAPDSKTLDPHEIRHQCNFRIHHREDCDISEDNPLPSDGYSIESSQDTEC
jgi:hypothetical protein